MGFGAVAFALASTPDGSYAIVGCDPIGMTALISLDNTGLKDRLVAVD
ncbi:MAG: hypothetical protein QGF24_09720 [Dehalococcoidia bacterium]|nr:hypothetical protein [Dehalococcoidia bacterium]